MLSIIVAKSKNNVIGKDNKLIWHIPEDLKRFKNLTTGHTIIMGRKTFESLGRVLPNRYHIVLSKNKENFIIKDENVEVLDDIKNLKKYINTEEECFVIGGETIYKLLMPYCKKMYITEIDEDFDGDVYFPKIDLNQWKVIKKEKGITNEKNPYQYEYITYKRIFDGKIC